MTPVVLMYHALVAGELVPGADPHYSVSESSFRQQLQLAKDARLRLASVRDLMSHPEWENASVGITFDDGHISNFEVGVPLLVELQGSADFFVNPSTVGTPNHVSWSALRDMSLAGMSIQSHGYTHRYFDDLTPEEIRSELRNSKLAIEDQLGTHVTLFAPPGGRIDDRVYEAARECGYQGVCTSRPGRYRASSWIVPRMAVLAASPLGKVEDWILGREPSMTIARSRYWIAYSMKRALGNSAYEQFRRLVLGLSGRGSRG
jgi:peptidoglycan/xylan/chitin deacetylase (PgdA/CDA1 family)